MDGRGQEEIPVHHGKEFGVHSSAMRRPNRLGQCKEWSKFKFKIVLWFPDGEWLAGLHDGTLGNQKGGGCSSEGRRWWGLGFGSERRWRKVNGQGVYL